MRTKRPSGRAKENVPKAAQVTGTVQRKTKKLSGQKSPSNKAAMLAVSPAPQAHDSRYTLLGMFAGLATGACASVLGSFEAKDEANDRAREELYKIKAYARDSYGTAPSSKQTQSREIGGLLQLTVCLQDTVQRDDCFRWQVIEPGEDLANIAAAFFNEKGMYAARVRWMDDYSFGDSLDLWLAV